MDDWCDQQDWVPDGDRVYRCTKCGKRLYPRARQEAGEFLAGSCRRQTKGHKIKVIKACQHIICTAQRGGVRTAQEDEMKRDELGKYWRKVIKGKSADAKVIDPASVVTAPWVRLKCKYGCEMFGREYCCPPETPSPEQTREILDGYQRAILFHYQAAKKEGENDQGAESLPRRACELEGRCSKTAITKPLYSFQGRAVCVLNARSRRTSPVIWLPRQPSMESCGIDVYQTAWNNDFYPAPSAQRGTQNLIASCL
jgi:predicted metal-binding protein